jgi:hypothetical protein
MFNVYKNQQSRQTGSRNLMSPKPLPTIWGTYMKQVIVTDDWSSLDVGIDLENVTDCHH